MNEKIIFNKIKTLLGSSTIVTESTKSIEKKRKALFMSIVDELNNVTMNSELLSENYGINTMFYEEPFYFLIETLLVELWGDEVATVIFWWVYQVRQPQKDVTYYIEFTDIEEKHDVKNLNQVYNVLKKLKLFKK
jgi:hypothetical protein